VTRLDRRGDSDERRRRRCQGDEDLRAHCAPPSAGPHGRGRRRQEARMGLDGRVSDRASDVRFVASEWGSGGHASTLGPAGAGRVGRIPAAPRGSPSASSGSTETQRPRNLACLAP
jgi:hypothetical protein